MNIRILRKIFGWATIVFTLLTAIFLLSIVWGEGWSSVWGKFSLTFFILAAFSFVLFIVANFWPRKNSNL